MTRQDKIRNIGNCEASNFQDTSKNQMSYFIIPLPHNLYHTTQSKTILSDFSKLGWVLANSETEIPEKKNAKRIFPFDPRNMNAIKTYVYEQMLPHFSYKKDKKDKSFSSFLSDFNNIMFQKLDLEKKWIIESLNDSSFMKVELDGIDLWIFNRHLSFFTIRLKQDLNDKTSISKISSNFNRVLREFREAYVDDEKYIFSNNKEQGVPLVNWLLKLITKENSAKNLLDVDQSDFKSRTNSLIFNNSLYAKMITAVHIDNEHFNDIPIISKTNNDIAYNDYDSIRSIQEIPFLLGSTSELYPSAEWENSEKYIYDQIKLGGIHIWKNWSGIAMKDSMAFFAVGKGGAGIVNQARHGYYFIYMVNLYVNYSLRMFEDKLIDKEFVDIENIYPLYVEQQRLRNQIMSVEIATMFQPNIVHNAISKAMRTDDVYTEIKQNIDTTLSLTQKNTDMMITAIISIFTFSGIWISQDKLLELFNDYPIKSIGASGFILSLAIILVINRSKVIKHSRKLRKKILKNLETIFD